MDENQLQRDIKRPMKDLIKFLGDQGTGDHKKVNPEHIIAKIALNYRLQKKLITPTWILAFATMQTLIATLCITFYQKQVVEDQIQSLYMEVQQLRLQMKE